VKYVTLRKTDNEGGVCMEYALAILLAYLLGCSNMALYISKIKKLDLRAGGSGNLGASNATALMGWRAGATVAVHDIGKSALAVVLAKLMFPQLPLIGAVAGVASVLGHIFPFYLKFKGGKGFASYIGMTLALNWKLALVIMALVLIVTLITDYIVVGTTLTILSVPT
jgi:glycerol-3-phosphate acyltransferase PlsY